ncbi:hypothetical protein COV18_06930 [Candidatus Woesearchaeota archaeon CG10_big_fil_rev_8_21_14_0_10_37_12]|nr:MAG: hypothetical protein COV18_06930 [Candidatus Woesearchaeota archaeon CG10_big_fil_rev_8_21_14_0_10_37_12]
MDMSILKDAGLTEGEVKVYLSLLDLGLTTTGPIVDKSGVARCIIYQLLEKLIQKGLVSYIFKNQTKQYQAAEPTKILEYIDRRESALKLNRTKVEKIVPELLLKQAMNSKGEATIYVGFKGAQTAHEHQYLKLKKGDGYCILGVPAEQPETHHLYWQRDHVRRAKVGINCRMLFNQGTAIAVLKNRNSYKFCDARLMPSDIVTPALFMTYKDTTLILIQNPTVIAIEIVNQGITDSFQAYFEEFWKRSKPFT